MSQSTRAIVAEAPGADHTPGSNWSLQQISVPPELKDGELLVEMVATGICHTDLLTTSMPAGMRGATYPSIAGHEGSGYVRAMGPAVTKQVQVGDPVLLSFDHCGACESCEARHPAYCTSFSAKNIPCTPGVFRTEGGDAEIAGKYFGQSSFASLSVVNQNSVLPAGNLVQSKEELQLFAPLGCGIQTGAGAILNLAKPGPKERVMILGLGGVGLAAVMAAKVLGCAEIIAVDRIESRIELAKDVGATHGLNTSNVEDLVSTFKEATGGLGPTCVVDTTAHLPLIKAAHEALSQRGTFVFVGASGLPNYSIELGITPLMVKGTRLIGCIEGDSFPEEFIPQLIKYQREGKFQLDKISRFYKAEDFKQAVHDMHTGETVKPILLW